MLYLNVERKKNSTKLAILQPVTWLNISLSWTFALAVLSEQHR